MSENNHTVNGVETRVMISKMVFENFKSYAGVQEIGPFHKNFSAVVGPNGSGKSNVIDGLLFVCGHRAKKLRQSKLGELIHNSPEHPDLTSTKVSIHWVRIIDHPNGDFEIVPGTESVISRVARKNHSSDYYVNNKKCSYQHARDVLCEYGIDLDHNRFLILQGEVEQIATMKPKALTEHDEGLLEYLEDIIGSNKYVERIKEAGEEVEKLNAARTEHINRVRLVERERDRLEGAKVEAEEYLTQEGAIIQKRGELYQIFAHEAKNAVNGCEERKVELEGKLEKERESLKGIQSDLDEFEKNYEVKKGEYDEISQEMEKAKADFAVFERKDVQFHEDLKHLKQKAKKAGEAIKRHEKKKNDAEYGIRTGEEDISKQEKSIKKLEQTLKQEETALEKVYESLKGVTDPLREEMEQVQQDMIPHKQDMESAQSKVDVAEAERTLLVNEIEGADKAMKDTKDQLEDVLAKYNDAEDAVDRIASSTDAVNKKIKSTEKKLATLRPEAEELGNKIRTLRPQVEEAKSGRQSDESRNQVLRALLHAKDKKQLTGISNRLGDLGTIDDKYDVAISTACGQLNNVVVDTTKDGQRAVKMLRENNLGRCTFIILDELKYLHERAAKEIDTPEGVPRLFDLVNVSDEKYAPAFYFALRDTLVADNLEQATRIAYGKDKRWRVVTLDGKLIDTSGTMSGGGNRVSRGGMSSHASAGASAKDVAKMEKDLSAACDRLASVRQEIQQLEHTLSENKAELRALETEATKVNMDLKSLAEQKVTLENNIVELSKVPKKNVSEEKKRVAALDKEITKFSKQAAKARDTVEQYEAQVEALQKQLMEAGGVRLRAQKAKVDDLAKQIDESTSNLTKINVQISTARKTIEKAEAAIASAEEEAESIATQIAETKEAFKEIDDEAVKVMELYKATQDLLTEKADELEEITREYDTMKKAVAKMRTVEVDYANALDDIVHKLAESQSKIKHWELKLTSLKEEAVKLFQIDDESDAMDVDGGDEEVEEEDDVLKTKISIPTLSAEDIEAMSKDEVQYELTDLEDGLKKLSPNMSAIIDYRRRHAEYIGRVRELDAATEQRDAQRKEYDDLRKKRLDDFMAGFSVISMKLKEMYQMITLGGDAELELVDSLDPFSEGVLFSVRPPKKSWKNIINLSGGEKTLSSLALVFALHHYKPTPLYVMDEIDAALDFKNVSIVANYIKERTKNAQFIIISLRNNMFELADRLVGIYKTYNQTKSITINPHKFAVPSASQHKQAKKAMSRANNTVAASS